MHLQSTCTTLDNAFWPFRSPSMRHAIRTPRPSAAPKCNAIWMRWTTSICGPWKVSRATTTTRTRIYPFGQMIRLARRRWEFESLPTGQPAAGKRAQRSRRRGSRTVTARRETTWIVRVQSQMNQIIKFWNCKQTHTHTQNMCLHVVCAAKVKVKRRTLPTFAAGPQCQNATNAFLANCSKLQQQQQRNKNKTTTSANLAQNCSSCCAAPSRPRAQNQNERTQTSWQQLASVANYCASKWLLLQRKQAQVTSLANKRKLIGQCAVRRVANKLSKQLMLRFQLKDAFKKRTKWKNMYNHIIWHIIRRRTCLEFQLATLAAVCDASRWNHIIWHSILRHRLLHASQTTHMPRRILTWKRNRN